MRLAGACRPLYGETRVGFTTTNAVGTRVKAIWAGGRYLPPFSAEN
jgi:hypothetical protein